MHYVFGPSFDALRVAPTVGVIVPAPEPPAPSKLDVAVSLTAVDEVKWTATLAIPAYSLETHNRLVEVRAYLVAAGHPVPASAQEYVDSTCDVTVDNIGDVQDGGDDVIALPDVDGGRYVGQVILGFES